jgi:hypothetical protein
VSLSASQKALLATHVVWTVTDPVPDAVYQSIASQVASGSPAVDVPAGDIIWHLKARHVIFSHASTDAGIPKFVNGQFVAYGDCGQGTSQIPSGGLKALSDVSAGLAAGVGIGGAAVAGLGGATAATAAGLGALNVIPIVGTIAAVALLPLELIFAHHAAAVSKEQGTLCAWFQAINQWFDAVDQAVQSGAMLPADGIAALHSMQAQYDTGVAGVSAACSPGNTNAACDEKGFVEALVLLRTWMYNNLAMFQPQAALAPAANPLAALLGGSTASGSLSVGGGLSPVEILLLLAGLLFL